jgi:hypothetical protein
VVGESNEKFEFGLPVLSAAGGEGTSVVFNVELSAPMLEAASVRYQVTSAAAEEERDYSPAEGTVHFAPGSVTGAFAVVIHDDGESDPGEILDIVLKSPFNVVIREDARYAYTINDGGVVLIVISAHGTASPAVGTNYFGPSTPVACAVLDSPVPEGAGTQYVCIGWTGTGSVPAAGEGTNTPGVVLSNNSSITWHWSTNVWLAAATEGGGSVAGADRWFGIGTNVQVEALTDAYYYFGGWSGDVGGGDTNAPLHEVAMDRTRALLASFQPYLATNGVPQWWLALHYGPTSDFDTVALSDTDTDSAPAWAEYIADTDPTNALSVFRILQARGDDGDIRLWWASSEGREYAVWRTTNPVQGWPPPPLAGNIAPDPSGTNVFTDAVTDRPTYYRIGVRMDTD